MTDLTQLYEELANRSDEGSRFYKEVIVNGEYKDALSQNIVLDIGANLGDFSYYIYDYARIIFSIEAHHDNFRIFKEYVDKYNLNKIKPFHLAIAGDNGYRDLYERTGCGGYSIIDSGPTVENVQAMTINTFLTENNINHVNILKIDVESAEEEIFNSPDFPQAASKIDFIIGENHGKDLRTPIERNGFVFNQQGPTFTGIKI